MDDLIDKMQRVQLSDSSNKSFMDIFNPVDDLRSTLHAAPSPNNDDVDSAVVDLQHTLLPNEGVTGQNSENCASNSMSEFAGLANVSVTSKMRAYSIWLPPPCGKKVCFISKIEPWRHFLTDHCFHTLKPWNLVDGHVINYHWLALGRHKNVLILHTDLVKGILNETPRHEINCCFSFFWDGPNVKQLYLSELLTTDLSTFDAIFGAYLIETPDGNHWNLLTIYPKMGKVCFLDPCGSSDAQSELAAQKLKKFFKRQSGEPEVENPIVVDADWKGFTIDHQVQLSNDFVNCGPIVMHFGFVMMNVLPNIPSYINFDNDERGLDQLRCTHAALILDNSYQVDVNGVFGYDQPSSGGDWSSSCADGSDVVCAAQPQDHLQQVEEGAASFVRKF